MEASRSSSPARLLFLDNLRYLMVLVVVAFHVSAGYSGLNEFYIEGDSGGFFLGLRNILGSIPSMHVLFFVAGYFALPSLGNRGYGVFLWRKFCRLGLPFLFCVFFLGPLMPYLGYYSQSFNGLSSDSYWDFWKSFVGSGFADWFTQAAFTTNSQFHPMHYWFLSALLQFFVLFALGHAVWKRWGAGGGSTEKGGEAGGDMTRILLVAGLLIAVLGVVENALDLPRGNFALVFHNPFSSFFTYGGYFALGVYAQGRGWFQEGRAPGLRTFGVLLGALAGLGLVGFGIYQFGQEAVPDFLLNSLGNLFGALFNLWVLVIFTGLTHRFMNRPSAVNAKLAAHSYTIYLIHYPLILVFRLLLLNWDGSALVKFPIVLLLAGIVSYVLSEYVIGRFPRFAAAGLVGLNLLLFVFGLPRAAHAHLLLERRDELRVVVPDERPWRVEDPRPDSLDTRTRGTPKAAISWEKGTLYFAFRPGGLHALLADGTEVALNPELELADIAPLPGGMLVAVDPGGRRIVELDGEGRVTRALVDSADSTGTRRRLISDSHGGIYFTTYADGEGGGKVWYRNAAGELRVALEDEEVDAPNGLALSADGETLFVNDVEDVRVWALDVGSDGSLSNRRAFAELFRADTRYGQPRSRPAPCQAEGMAADGEGRLYVATQFGVQVFSPAGRLLGVVTLPVAPDWRPKKPLSCVFGGADMSTLYVACGDEVYAVRTRMATIW